MNDTVSRRILPIQKLRDRLTAWAKRLKRDLLAVFLAGRNSRTPLSARMVALLIAAYALSPIDLIPDFIPVLGLLDDLILLPLGIMLVVRMIPVELMTEFRKRASAISFPKPNWYVGSLIVIVWIVAGAMLLGWMLRAGL